jgi:hypothetical protein
LKDGKDVGYSYIVEGQGRVRHKSEAEREADARAGRSPPPAFDGSPDGITVGIRTRVMTRVENGKLQPFPREDTESWMFCSTDAADRRSEDWSAITVWDDDGKPKSPQSPWRKVSEIGTSKHTTRRAAAVAPDDPARHVKRGEVGDSSQPWVDNRDSYTLDVQFKATRGDLQPVTRPLPPFYLPQALGEMLPRLVPAKEPKTYMLYAYVSAMREVMSRYVDVRPEEALPADLARLTGVARGVPIDDRLGYEGVVTTHYVTVKGDYLGSVTKSAHQTVVPADEQTIKQIWNVTDIRKMFELAPDALASTGPIGPAAAGKPQLTNPTGAGALPSRVGQ